MVKIISFNPRARDGREQNHADGLSVKHVSIHAPVMDANKTDPKTVAFEDSFNPRARDGREGWYWGCLGYRDVSIHAPVMDAN